MMSPTLSLRLGDGLAMTYEMVLGRFFTSAENVKTNTVKQTLVIATGDQQTTLVSLRTSCMN